MTAVPESKDPAGRRLDLPGQVLAITALGAMSIAVIEGPHWGWLSIASFISFVISSITAASFLWRQANTEEALVPLPMLKNPVFSASLAVATAMTFGSMRCCS